jgi:uncharacterized protein YecT (DUF1311 family)
MSKISISILFILITFTALAEDTTETRHPIDIRLEECLSIDSNYTTYGMMRCEAIARDEWDKEMNKYYNLLIKELSEEDVDRLRASQRQWLSYRDKEVDFSSQMYYGMEGTMWRVVAASSHTDIIKTRALELKSYYEMLTFDRDHD